MTYNKFDGSRSLKEMTKNFDIDFDYPFEMDVSSIPEDEVRVHFIKYCNMVRQGLL